jgi:hypothetical protein
LCQACTKYHEYVVGQLGQPYKINSHDLSCNICTYERQPTYMGTCCYGLWHHPRYSYGDKTLVCGYHARQLLVVNPAYRRW